MSICQVNIFPMQLLQLQKVQTKEARWNSTAPTGTQTWERSAAGGRASKSHWVKQVPLL